MKRCINIDWLEVHAREPQDKPMNSDFFREQGYMVIDRDYGTRVYREMFTVFASDDLPWIEIRRNPASQGLNGIHDAEECHLRLVNRACYFNNAVQLMNDFLSRWGYERIRISRIDICMDFDRFDRGDKPARFVANYFKQVYAKINQCNITGHGDDNWNGQVWNSVSWGSKASQVSTKLYNKTKELYDLKTGTFKKPYILHAWQLCGYIDNMLTCTLEGQPVDMWRLEFSITSPDVNWVKIELNGKQREYQSLRHTLETYNTRSKLLVMFASLCAHYFRFKIYEDGQRKDRCKDKVLFVFKEVEEIYKIQRDDYTLAEDTKRTAKWLKLLPLLIDYRNEKTSLGLRSAVNEIISSIQWDIEHANLVSPWSEAEMEEFREFIENRLAEENITDVVITNEIREVLNIKDRTLRKFKDDDEEC